jgi:hypothetical protein
MPTSDDERYALLHRNYQDLAAGVRRIREAVERAFDMTLPSATTSGQFEVIVQAIYDAAADRPRPASTPVTHDKTRAHFQYRIDLWDDAGENIVEHVAGLEDYAVAQAAYDRACRRWPTAVVTLRQGARVMERSRAGNK